MVLAGLREAEPIVKGEAKQVPVHIEEKRFGHLPRWAQAKIERMTGEELHQALMRFVGAQALGDVVER